MLASVSRHCFCVGSTNEYDIVVTFLMASLVDVAAQCFVPNCQVCLSPSVCSTCSANYNLNQGSCTREFIESVPMSCRRLIVASVIESTSNGTFINEVHVHLQNHFVRMIATRSSPRLQFFRVIVSYSVIPLSPSKQLNVPCQTASLAPRLTSARFVTPVMPSTPTPTPAEVGVRA